MNNTVPVCYVANSDNLSILGEVNVLSMRNGSLVYRVTMKNGFTRNRRNLSLIKRDICHFCRSYSIDSHRLVVA
jgi:hypothetical protein